MVETVCHQNVIYDPAMNEKQKVIMNDLKIEKRIRNENLLNDIKSTIADPIRLRSLEASLEKMNIKLAKHATNQGTWLLPRETGILGCIILTV